MDFNTSGTMRSPFSPRVRQSITGRRPIGLSSAKKTSSFMQSTESQSGDVIYKTPFTTVETYGMPLPVMVTEALTFASGDVSVRLSANGWCWLVTGRRILAWPREVLAPSGASPAPSAPPAARELTLPQTDLAHKADLVIVFYQDDAKMPSCIGVSPEGVVRYWECIAQEGAFVEVSCELGGQECERLCDGLLLATTTPTLVLLKPTTKDGRPTVSCQTLRPPSGWLGGIGRRVSLLFFGSMPAHAETKVVGVVVVRAGPLSAEGGGLVALVAGGGGGGPVLQLWSGAELYTHSLRRALAHTQQGKQLQPHGDLSSVEIVCVDVRADGAGGAGLTLLLAAVSVANSPDTRYAIAHISVEDPANPVVTWLAGIRTWAGAELQPRFLPLRGYTLLYTRHCIGVVSTNPSNDKADFIDVSSEGDQILGAELCNGVPLVFSKKHGVLALTIADNLAPTPGMCASPAGDLCAADVYDGNLSLYEIDPHEVSMVTTDACGKLKAAFLFHLRRDTGSCRALVDELFPAPAAAAAVSDDVDAVLDRTVMKIARDMLDDIPNGDPRWKQRPGGPLTNIALGSSSALQIEAQLRDKQRAFSLFLHFLRAQALWNRLKLVTRESGGGAVPTVVALQALWEQLAAAIALRRLQQGAYRQLIDAKIQQVVCGEKSDIDEEEEAALCSGALSPSDVCYRRLRTPWRVLRALAAPPPTDPAHTLHALHIIINVLQEMSAAGAAWGGTAAEGGGALVLGPRPLLPALADLHQRALTQVAKNCPDQTMRSSIYEASAQLADLVLTHTQQLPARTHAHSPYERTRTDMIAALMDAGQVERACVLAEKFHEWELLVAACVRGDRPDLDRLCSYIDRYPDQGIAELAFAALVERGGACIGALVRGLGARYGPCLAAWLARAPSRRALLALHQLHAARLTPAAATLAALAADETASVHRLQTTASLAKLCLLAGEEEIDDDIHRLVERQLSLAEQHAALPRDIRVRYGLDTADTAVLPPAELVQMYIESESKSLTEYDYKKALDLTEFVTDIERRDDLRLRVWCASILRDSWAECRVDAPAAELADHTFFRLVDLVHVMGGDVEVLLPPVDEVLGAPQLGTLAADARFRYLLQYGYQCLAARAV